MIADLAVGGFSKVEEKGAPTEGYCLKFHDGYTQIDIILFYKAGNKIDTGIVMAGGTFDLIHANHVTFLEECKCLGEYLSVVVMSDELVRGYKRQPVFHEDERLKMVRALKCVDEASILRDQLVPETLNGLLKKYNPRAVVYSGGEDWAYYNPAVEAGIMVNPAYRQGTSSSAIIQQIKSRPDLCNAANRKRANC